MKHNPRGFFQTFGSIERNTMTIRNYISVLAILCLSQAVFADDTSDVSHGPMLGAVSEHAARMWVRTTAPADVTCALFEVGATAEPLTQKVRTALASDNTCIITFDELKKETEYRYVVRVGKAEHRATFTTLGPSLTEKGIRIVYGYGYNHKENKMKPDTSVFKEMASRKANLTLFLGDFPYTAKGAKDEVREGHRKLRDVIGFTQLTASTPTYGIYDDHDFGPNDCDGTHKNADEALEAFKEYWPNPSYGLPEDKGNYCSFVVGDVEFFLLDGRYPARKKQKTMLGKIQFKWLCDGLKHSKSRYKVLVSGTQFGRVKADGWAGKYYLDERKKLFSFISENEISGVIGISGDVHRSDIYKLPIGKDQYFYDFTPGSLARTHRTPPKSLPDTMIHSYGKTTDNNMYGEIEFRPASDKNVAIIFRSLSAKNGLIYEHKLTPNDLALKE
jgi:alkaline phosphatase D